MKRLGMLLGALSVSTAGMVLACPAQPAEAESFQHYKPSIDLNKPIPSVTTPNYTRTTHYFQSAGLNCEGWLFMPSAPAKSADGKVPTVVMAHGLGLQKDCQLQVFADEFIKKGMAVFMFDYRTFGGSEGNPRHWVSGTRHVEDWGAALQYLKTKESSRLGKMALWGSSFSGGHVLVSAAKWPENIACVISQVPYLSFIQTMPDNIQEFGLMHIIRMSCAATRDILSQAVLNKPYYIRSAVKPGEWGMLSTPECFGGYLGLIPENALGGWKNVILGRLAMSIMFYQPSTYASKVRCPVMMVAGVRDSICSVSMAQKVSKKIGDKCTYIEMDTDHFAVYKPPIFPRNVDLQTQFLKEHLMKA